MERILKFVPASTVLYLLSLVASPALAAPAATPATSGSLIKGGLTKTASLSGFESTPLPLLIGKVIQALLGVVGIMFLVLIVYGGYLYLTDMGSGDKVKKAKQLIGSSLIGLIIFIAAYALTDFVIGALVKVTTEDRPG